MSSFALDGCVNKYFRQILPREGIQYHHSTDENKHHHSPMMTKYPPNRQCRRQGKMLSSPSPRRFAVDAGFAYSGVRDGSGPICSFQFIPVGRSTELLAGGLLGSEILLTTGPSPPPLFCSISDGIEGQFGLRSVESITTVTLPARRANGRALYVRFVVHFLVDQTRVLSVSMEKRLLAAQNLSEISEMSRENIKGKILFLVSH